eukprot:TRINITY_DN1779_c0_g1_i2.p1 TRINITY_DN1779_c0_g1~~TRINITY_DN1779_c0_g1_i2.p1  ORF type:complete len:438 (+),score=39.08 TRINITY_DN1779_c0_g1_i2:236-1549(+)
MVRHAYQSIKLTAALNSNGAQSLDGSNGGYYFAPGTGNNANKWVFMLELGSYCQDEQDCISRSQTNQGTTNGLSATDAGVTIVSDSPDVNPDFYSWNRVRIPYCSADLYLGTRTSVSTETFGLWFSGFNIIRAVIAELNQTRSLASATDIIWSGESAGAVASFMTVDYIATSFPSASVTVVPNSGFFTVETPWPGSNKINKLPGIFDLWQPRVPSSCAAVVGSSNLSSCTTGEVGPLYVTVPSFWVISVSDVYILAEQLGFNQTAYSTNPIGALSFFTNFYNSRIQKLKQTIFNRSRRGYWITSAVLHVLTQGDNCTSTGLNWIQMFGNWYFNRNGIQTFFDECGASQTVSRITQSMTDNCPAMRTCTPDGSSLPPPSQAPLTAPVAKSPSISPPPSPSSAPQNSFTQSPRTSSASTLMSAAYLSVVLLILFIQNGL